MIKVNGLVVRVKRNSTNKKHRFDFSDNFLKKDVSIASWQWEVEVGEVVPSFLTN